MASRRRRTGLTVARLRGKTAVDEGTPETRARLQPPPWARWGQELQDAAQAIELAIRLQAGGSMAQAQDMLHLRHHASEEGEGWQGRLERRYSWWRWEIVRSRMPLAALLACIAEQGPAPECLQDALRLWATLPATAVLTFRAGRG